MEDKEIQTKFDDWFYGFYGRFSFLSEYFFDDCAVADLKKREKLLKQWMEISFKEGYKEGRQTP